MDNSLTVATCNVNGIRNIKKRNSIFTWLKSLKLDIIFLQETHCHLRKESTLWSREWGVHSLWSRGTNNSKGVAVLFNSKLDYHITKEVVDSNGRYINFNLKIGETVINLINIYAPNDNYERVKFFNELNTHIDCEIETMVGGDFNCAIDSKLDRLNCTYSLDIGQIDLKKIMNDKNLEDVWRRRNPKKQLFSWNRNNKSSRIDYWLVSESLDSQVDKTEYIPCIFSDHDMALLRINLSHTKQGPGTWKMNLSVIESDLFRICFTDMWSDWKKQKIIFSNEKIWWDLGKKKIKNLAIWCAGKLKQDRDYEKSYLEDKIKYIKTQIDHDTIELSHYEEKLRDVYNKEAQGIKIRSRAQWFEEGEQSTKYFHSLEKIHAKNKNWDKILDSNGKICMDTNDIINVQVDFYKKLYSSAEINKNECDFFSQQITKKVSSNSHDMLNARLHLDELKNALRKMKNNKSPGPDGIIVEFYKIYWNIVKNDLFDIFEISYESQELPYSQYLALIVLLYKKGLRELITNWRPISLSNTDIKIISKVLAERLKKVLPEIIETDQSGCIIGRKIGHNIRLIEDIIEEMDDDNVILLIDQQKAFDRVEWEWLFLSLEKYNIGEYFINWIKVLYRNMKSAVLTNGFVSSFFPIERGIRQGDSLSALLYIIQSEPLSESIRTSKDIKGITIENSCGDFYEIKGCQYVDDSTNMLFSINYFHNCLGIIERFGEASGSRINKSKTIALVSEHFQDNQSILNGFPVTSGPEKILGIPMGVGVNGHIFWSDKIEKMNEKLSLWKQRDLTMFGKVHVIRSIILPLFQYAFAHISIDKPFIDRIQKIIWEFIWEWKTCFVHKDICYLPRKMGGLNIPHFELYVKASRIRMLIDIVRKPSKWNLLARKYICFLDKKL